MGRKPKDDGTTNPVPSKIVLPLASDGAIDWDRIRPSMRGRFLAAVEQDVTTLEYIGMRAQNEPGTGEPGDGSELTTGITIENVSTVIDLLGQMNGVIFRVIASKSMKHPLLKDQNGKPLPLMLDPDILKKAFTLDADQHKELDPRALKCVRSMPMPEWMKKNLDLWLLGGMFLKYSAENAQKAIAFQLQRDFQKIQMAKVNTKGTGKPVDSDIPAGPSNGSVEGTSVSM